MSSSGQPVEGAKQTFYGTGRRKESVARVFLTFGSGKISINGRTVDEYFRNVNWRNRAVEPMKFTETSGSVDVVATVKGGGVSGQSGAVRMGLSRALAIFNPELRALRAKKLRIYLDDKGLQRHMGQKPQLLAQ